MYLAWLDTSSHTRVCPYIRISVLLSICPLVPLSICLNKAGYTAIQSRMVGQERYRENRSEFRNVTDGRTDGRTDRPTRQGVESRVRD